MLALLFTSQCDDGTCIVVVYLVDAMRSFIPNAAMVHTHSFGDTQSNSGNAVSSFEDGKFVDHIVVIDDEVVRLSAIPLRPSQYRGSTIKPGYVAVIYACELPEIKGNFDKDKAVALGLRAGPKYRELQLRNSVMSDALNIMVHPSDVLGPSLPGPIVLLVDFPTQSHMQELLALQALNCYYMDSSDHSRDGSKSVNCIIHMGPSSVTKHADYQEWMKKFGSAQHIMAGHEMILDFWWSFSASSRHVLLNSACTSHIKGNGGYHHNIENVAVVALSILGLLCAAGCIHLVKQLYEDKDELFFWLQTSSSQENFFIVTIVTVYYYDRSLIGFFVY